MTSLIASAEAIANTTTTGAQIDSAVVYHAVFGWYNVVWSYNGSIWTQRFQDGNPAGIWGQQRVNSSTATTYVTPSAVSLAADRFMVVFAGGGNIVGQTFTGAGDIDGTNFTISTGASMVTPATALLTNGNVVVTYSNGAEIFNRIVSNTGSMVTSQAQVNTYTTGAQTAPAVAATSDGGYVVVWQSQSQEDGSTLGVYGQRYNSGGTAVGSEFHVNTTTALVQSAASVAGLTGGGFVVIWQSQNQDGASYGIYGQLYNSSGATVGGEFQVNSYFWSSQDTPVVVATSDGGFVVGWQQTIAGTTDAVDGSDSGVFAQRFDANAHQVGQEIRLSSTTAGAQTAVSLAARTDGGFISAWTTPDANLTGIASRDFKASTSAPVVTAASPTLGIGSSLDSAALVIGGHVQGNAGITAQLQDLTSYQFIDNTSAGTSGYFSLNGVTQSAGSTITVSASQLHTLRFVAGSQGGSDSYQFRVYDGDTWSGWQSGTINTIKPIRSLTGSAEQRVNTTQTGYQTDASVAYLSGGGYVVTWNYLNTGNIYQQRFDASNTKVGSQTLVNTAISAGTTIGKPEVTALNDGGYLITWAGGGHINAQRYDLNGLKIGEEFHVNPGASGSFALSSTAVLKDGSFVVTYSSADVYGQRFDADGHKLGGQFLVNTYTTNGQSDPSVAATADGGFVVVWQSQNQEDATTYGIYGQRYDSSGAAVGGEFHVNTFTASHQQYVSVTGLADGDFLVVWASQTQDVAGYGIYGQRYNANGTTDGGEFLVSTYEWGAQAYPTAIAMADGGFLVAWAQSGTDDPLDDNGAGVFAKRFDASGHKIGDEFRIAATVTGDQSEVDVAARPDGGFVATWRTPDTDLDGISSRVFSALTSGPTVTARNVQVIQGKDQWGTDWGIAGSALVVAGHASGAVGITSELTQPTAYEFIDNSTGFGTGYFTVSGVKQTEGVSFSVTAAQLGTVRFIGGLLADTDNYQVRANDGLNWGAWANGTVSTVATTLQANGTPGTLTASAALQVSNTLFQQNSHQNDPSIAALAGGGAVVTFTNSVSLFFQLYDAANNKVGAATPVITADLGIGQLPHSQVQALPDGGFVIVWDGESHIHGQRYNPNGVKVGVEFRIDTGTGYSRPSVALDLATNNLGVVYAGQEIYGQIVAPDGSLLGSQFQVNTYTTNVQSAPAIAANWQGGFVVSWVSQSQEDGSTQGIYAAGLDSNGNQVSPGEIHVNTTTTGHQTQPVVAMYGHIGNRVMVWTSAGQDGSGGGIYLQLFDSAMGKIGGEVRVNTYTTSDQTQPTIVQLADRGFAIAWTSAGQDGSGNGVYYQRYDQWGAAFGSETLVPAVTFDDQDDPVIAGRPDGGFYVGWVSELSAANFYDNSFMRVWSGTVAGTGLYNPVTGGTGNDTLAGTSGRDRLAGLGGNDSLSGNADDDVLEGAAGNDTLDGGTGNDVLVGGTGNDVLLVDSPGDVPVELSGEGIDEIRTTLSSTNLNTVYQINGVTQSPNQLEHLTYIGAGDFVGSGNTLDNRLTGNTGNDSLFASDGDDTMDGGTGNDTMDGGFGNDVYYVDSLGDFVTDGVGSADEVRVSTLTAYTLGTGFEILTYLGGADAALTGSTINNKISGGTGNDTLNGLNGNDTLYGGAGGDRLDGGSGTDTMVGNGGNDDYWVDATSDVVIEAASEGVDQIWVQASSYTMPGNVENMYLLASGGTLAGNGENNIMTGSTGHDSIHGGAGNDAFTGDAGNDTLDGGTGNDVMTGDPGNDIFYIDSVGDKAIEAVGGGTDEVRTTVANDTLDPNIEILTFIGTGDFAGTGNADNNGLNGGAGNDTLDGGAGADTLGGGLGDDRFIVDDAGDSVVENASEGTDEVRTTLTGYALGANVENLVYTGGSDFTGTGNGLANAIAGAAGNDTLDGQGGADTLAGNGGNDTYVVDNSGDVVSEGASAGTDTVRVSLAGYTLGANVENLVYTGSGDFTGTGNGAANALTGGAGNDTLDGQGGNDTLTGGAGNDLYLVDASSDSIVEGAAEGTDTVQATSGSYTLSANVENLVYAGGGNFAGTGNADANEITGGTGADTLDGAAGADSMAGGQGDDRYVVDDAGDVVSEAAAEGTDLVQASISYTLGSNVENLTLTGSGSIDGAGNTLANALAGNSGANSLSGSDGNDTLDGGSGADSLAGGTGDDLFLVDNAGDLVTENASEGTDEVRTGLGAYTLTAEVENLVHTASSAFAGTGNAGANAVTGNIGNDTLDGAAGADTLSGDAGNDTYVVDDLGDSVVESGGGGTDLVQASVSHTLAANVENLTLTGSGGIDGTGNTLANLLTGNSGANALSGNAGSDTLDGGTGADTMAGGVDDDRYVVDDAGDVVTENAAEGTDEVRTGLSGYTLTAEVENLVYTGGATFAGAGNGLANAIAGGAGADTVDGGAGADTLTGNGGDDTYVVDDAGDSVVEGASAGTDTVLTSRTSYTLGTNVENVAYTGGSDFAGIGNAVANALSGGAGHDSLDGGGGADTLTGGDGNDLYTVDNAGDSVVESAAQGTDTVQTGLGAHTLAAQVENLTYTGGATFAGTGNGLANAIVGGAGADTLDGGTGADTLTGKDGNDRYVVDDAGDSVVENAAEGTDTVYASVGHTLAANVENLVLTGAGTIDGTGNALANAITGNGGANSLSGSDGNDTLDGGAGADSLAGGSGDDRFLVDDAGDLVTENAAEGTDEVRTGLTGYTLTANVENLVYTGGGNFAGSGNGDANQLTGGSGADTLDGGSGADTLTGNGGNDTYVVEDAGDSVVEGGGGGTDLVQASVSHTLAANVENLTLTGSGSIDGAGNTLANLLTGNSGANSLSGGDGGDTLDGGTGADSLAGGAGDDRFLVDDAGDLVTENSSEGTDEVRTGLTSYTLTANVENLVYTGGGNFAGTGNGDANQLTGGSGADTLDGGAGADTLAGNGGDDTYVVGAGDSVVEGAAAGTDTVQTGLSGHTLGTNLENLVYTGGSDFAGTGNSAANALTGGAGNDTLDGGAGADTLVGGTGDDRYLVDDAGDVVTEGSAAGTDEVRTGLSSYTLGSNLENLVYTGAGTFAGTGNAAANLLTGGSGNDTLTGDDGADTLAGGSGADLFAYRTGDGADQIDDFIYGDGDRLEIATGMGYSLSDDGNGNAIIDFGGGDTVKLIGTASASITNDWFVTV